MSDALLPVARQVVTGLSSMKSDERVEAERLLAHHGSDLIPALLEVATEQYANWQKRRRKYKRIAWTFIGIAAPLMLTIIGLAIYYGVTGRPNISGILLSATIGPVLGGGGGGILGGCSGLLNPPAELVAVGEALRRFQDARAIGPLAASLEMPDPKLRASSSAQLALLLPTLNVEEALSIPIDRRNALYRRLNLKAINSDSQLVLGILHLAQISEDVAALKPVTALCGTMQSRLASGIGGVTFGEVLEKAVECSGVLELAAQRSDMSATLLRPASGYEMDLLRPAGAPSETDTDLLLRPRSGE